jgi:hypothetical protein
MERALLCANGFNYHSVNSPSGLSYGTCCATNLPGAVWDENKPACSLGIRYTTPAQEVQNCPPDTHKVDTAGLKTCFRAPLRVKRDEFADQLADDLADESLVQPDSAWTKGSFTKRREAVCKDNGKYFKITNKAPGYGACCKPGSTGATWDKKFGPTCCDPKGCKATPVVVKTCPTGYEKRNIDARIICCRKA